LAEAVPIGLSLAVWKITDHSAATRQAYNSSLRKYRVTMGDNKNDSFSILEFLELYKLLGVDIDVNMGRTLKVRIRLVKHEAQRDRV
jgi:hypothetical protein